MKEREREREEDGGGGWGGLEADAQRREFRQVIVPINNAADPPPPVPNPLPLLPLSRSYTLGSHGHLYSLSSRNITNRSVSYLVRTYRTMLCRDRAVDMILREPSSLSLSLPPMTDALPGSRAIII